jgi:2,5-diamino-6-(ribosylamino)-4(3H)-pyrimidinone 5'-phosphate reductase
MDVLVNAATSADGKLAGRRREQVRISGSADFDRLDALRADSDAVAVGVGTVLADDPSLTVIDEDRLAEREAAGRPRQPARVVADSRARTPPGATVLDDAATTYVLVSEAAPAGRVENLRESGAEVLAAGATGERVDLPTALDALEARGIADLLVEGGGELIFSLFREHLVDRLSVFVGPQIIGGREAPTLADGEGFADSSEFVNLDLESIERLEDGVLLRYDVD